MNPRNDHEDGNNESRIPGCRDVTMGWEGGGGGYALGDGFWGRQNGDLRINKKQSQTRLTKCK